jgi:ABC-type lipoprotein release transport system permease subunit
MIHLDVLSLAIKVGFRNLWLYRFKTFVVAALLGSGTFLVIMSLSLLRDVEASMRESIVGSLAGHLQVYSDNARDDLALFGGNFIGRVDIGELPNFVPYLDVIKKHPNVASCIPMGLDMARLARGNEMDDKLDALRVALKNGDAELIKSQKDEIRFQLQQLKTQSPGLRKLVASGSEVDQNEAYIAKAEAPGFLDNLTLQDEDKLQFLETRIAPISGEKPAVYLSYLGTDMELFQSNFPKFHIVEGSTIPPGQRGILISRKVRDDVLKVAVAKQFDQLYKRAIDGGASIKDDPDLQRMVKDLGKQYGSVISSIRRDQAQKISAMLAEIGIASGEPAHDLIGGISKQLQEFFRIDDTNLAARYQWFYENIVPLMRIYEVTPGEVITLRSYTRSGYLKSIQLKVYGIFTFTGIEDADVASQNNIIDLVSFRELYGKMTESTLKEFEVMRANVGIKPIDAEHAEDALFGEEASQDLVTTLAPVGKVHSPAPELAIEKLNSDQFDPSELKRGLALNIALKLKDPTKIQETRKQLEDALKSAGLSARVIDWQKASGTIGQFVNILRIVLLFAICIIFLVAMVIINNSIIMGTYNRIREIGTMRAIGAQKSFVVGLFLAETAITGLIGTMIGSIVALTVLLLLSSKGLRAPNDFVSFLFAGSRLYPSLTWAYVALVPTLVTLMATLASIYAARHAAHITPAEAMQEKE